MNELQIQATRTTFTENEVFGTSCGECGWTSFDAITPRECGQCGGENLDPADGCEIPYDDDHSTAGALTGTAPEIARWMRDRGLTEWQGDTTVYAVDGTHVVDYGTGLREELTVSGDVDTLGALIALIESDAPLDDVDALNDRELYR
jgi:hypothetical protein